MLKGKQLYLKPEEEKFLAMAVVNTIEQIQETSQDQFINWNPETRKDFNNMLAAGNGLKSKMEKLGFDMRDLPPFLDGDQNEFLTKES